MTEEKYKKAIEIKAEIDHLDIVLDLLIRIRENQGYGADNKAIIREIGFISHPQEAAISHNEVLVIIDALYEKRDKLNQEFKSL